ncbi:MAG: hypothetical protein K2X66_09505 [Cyanobacteria bacterium]|nr:hypothetical protein [Cyanobacteriota bacterium]
MTGFILLFYARTIGISLLLGQIISYFVNKKYDKQMVYSLLAGLALLPWMVWTQFQQQTNPLFQLYPLKDGLLYPNFINYMTAYQIQMGQYESFQSMFLINLNQFLIELGSWFIPAPVPLLGIQSVESIWGIGLLLFLFVVLSISVQINRHPTNPMPYYVGIYLFILLIWGDPVQHPRFLLVIAPFLLILLYECFSSFSKIKFLSSKRIPIGLAFLTILFILLNLQFFLEQEQFKNTPQTLALRQALNQDFQDAFKNVQHLTQPHQSLYGYYQTAWLLGVRNPVYSLRSIPAPSKVANSLETQIALKQKGIDLAHPDFVLISPFLQDDGRFSFDTLMIACLEKRYSPYKLIYSSPHQLIRLYQSTHLKQSPKEKQHDF